MNLDVRWKQRFQNFDRVYGLLREALQNGPGALNELEKEGVFRRFRFALDLAWETVKDYLEYSGIIIATVTPRQIIKDVFAAKIIADGQVWIDMLGHQNLLSHTYNSASFEKAVDAIAARYLPAMAALHQYLSEQNAA